MPPYDNLREASTRAANLCANAVSPAPDFREDSITAASVRLEGALDNLRNALDQHLKTLDPLLTDACPAVKEAAPKPTLGQSPVARKFHGLAEQVELITRGVEEMTRRVTLK